MLKRNTSWKFFLVFLCLFSFNLGQTQHVFAGGKGPVKRKVKKREKPTTRPKPKGPVKTKKVQKIVLKSNTYWTPRELLGIEPADRYVVLINIDTVKHKDPKKDTSKKHKKNIQDGQRTFRAMGFPYKNHCIVGNNPAIKGSLVLPNGTYRDVMRCLNVFRKRIYTSMRPSTIIVYTSGHGLRMGRSVGLPLRGKQMLVSHQFAQYVKNNFSGIRFGYIGDQCFSGGFAQDLARAGFYGVAFGLNSCAENVCQYFTPNFFRHLTSRLHDRSKVKVESIAQAYIAAAEIYRKKLQTVRVNGRKISFDPAVYFGTERLNTKGYKHTIDRLVKRSAKRLQVLQISVPTCPPCVFQEEKIDGFLLRTKGTVEYSFLTVQFKRTQFGKGVLAYLESKLKGFKSKKITSYPTLIVIDQGRVVRKIHSISQLAIFLRKSTGLQLSQDIKPLTRPWVVVKWCRLLKRINGVYPNICSRYVHDYPRYRAKKRKRYVKQIRRTKRNLRYDKFYQIWKQSKLLRGRPLMKRDRFMRYPRIMAPEQIEVVSAKGIGPAVMTLLLRRAGMLHSAMQLIRCGFRSAKKLRQYKELRPEWTVSQFCEMLQARISAAKLRAYPKALGYTAFRYALRNNFKPHEVRRYMRHNIRHREWYTVRSYNLPLAGYVAYRDKRRELSVFNSTDENLMHKAIRAGYPVRVFVGFPRNIPFRDRFNLYKHLGLTGQTCDNWPTYSKVVIWFARNMSVERQVWAGVILFLLIVLFFVWIFGRGWRKKYYRLLEQLHEDCRNQQNGGGSGSQQTQTVNFPGEVKVITQSIEKSNK